MNNTLQATLTLQLPQGLRNFTEFDLVARQQAAQRLGCTADDICLEYPSRLWWSRQAQSVQVVVRPAGEFSLQQKVQQNSGRYIQRGSFALGAVVLLISLIWIYSQYSIYQNLKQKNQTLQVELSRLQTYADEFTHNKNETKKISQLPQKIPLDLNPYFDAIEHITVPYVYLTQFTIDAVSGGAQLTYHLDSINAVTPLLHALNSGKNLDVRQPLHWSLKSAMPNQAVFITKIAP
jgi:hypothetical protein